MEKLLGTRHGVPLLCLYVAFTLICSHGAMAQTNTVPDKLLTNSGTNNITANPATVACTAYSGATCINGQYFHSDDAYYSPTWLSSFSSGEGNWLTGASGPGNTCTDCHHTFPQTADSNGILTNNLGANYLTTGHKNMLRKVAPGQPWSDWSGNPYYSSTGYLDPSGNAYNWTTGQITPVGQSAPQQLYYLFGWVDVPDVLYNGGGSTSNYQCARCHTTGYHFDNSGPEPTLYTPGFDNTTLPTYTSITDAQLNRAPADGACSVNPSTNKTYASCIAAAGSWATASWYLTGIQCERCHKADMQYSSGVFPLTGGRISHLENDIPAGTPMPTDFVLDPVSGVTVQPLAVLPVGPKSTALCIECHRQEVSTAPTTSGTTTTLNGIAYNLGTIHPAQLPGQTLTLTGPNQPLSLGAFKDNGMCSDASSKSYSACLAASLTWNYVPYESYGANGAEAFLNSPHARFNGTFDQTSQNSADLSVTLTGTYNSDFVDWGEAPGSITGGHPNAASNGGCAGCHDVHNSTLNANLNPTTTVLASNGGILNAANVWPALSKQCLDCHASHNQSIVHPTGPNTPFANVATDPNSSCVICHMAGANGAATYHYFRINPDPNYTTFPSAATYYASGGGNQQPLTYADPKMPTYQAVALDVDLACGQCHVGGNGVTNPYGLTPPTAGMPVLNRAVLASAAGNIHGSQANAPTFNPAPGTQLPLTNPTVSISGPSGLAIYYTLDGSTPTTASQSYATPITIASNGQTINAIAAAPITALTAIPTQANSSTSASMLDSSSGCYTPVYLTYANLLSRTIQGTCLPPSLADATANYTPGTGFTPSVVAVASYSVQTLAAPTFSPSSGSYTYPLTQKVTLLDSYTGAAIYYTTNGSAPTTGSTQYTTPFLITGTETVKAIAVVGAAQSAAATSGLYTARLAAPTFSTLDGGQLPTSYRGSAKAVLTNTDSSATICYTTNGSSTPTATVAGTCDTGSYTATVTPLQPIAITTSTTIKAIATAAGYTNSTVVSGTYSIY